MKGLKVIFNSENFANQNSISSSFNKVLINKYDFYISRQRYEDSNGQEGEVVGILTISISKLNYNSLSFDKIQIHFVSLGSIKKKYIINNNTLQIELVEKDMNTWQLGLSEKSTYLDISFFENNYLAIYLSSGNK